MQECGYLENYEAATKSQSMSRFWDCHKQTEVAFERKSTKISEGGEGTTDIDCIYIGQKLSLYEFQNYLHRILYVLY